MTRLVAAMDERLLVVDDGTARTVDVGDGRIECVHAGPAGDRLLVGTFGDGLHRSTDGGATWDRVAADVLAGDAVSALAANPHDPDELWAGTEPSAVYRSTDGGATWTPTSDLTALASSDRWSFPPRPDTHHVRWLTVDPADPAHLYVAVEAGALVTTHDRGATWHDRVPDSRRDTHSLFVHPDAPETVHCAAGDGFARSTDAGRSWTYPQAGLDHRYCWSVVTDPGDPATVLVSAASGAYAAHTAGRADTHVYRRRDWSDDGSWRRLADAGLPTGDGVTRYVFAAGDDPGVVYAASNAGLFRTPDAGTAWERVPADWPASFETATCRGLAVVP